MTFDYKELVKEAIKTSQPATRFRQLGCPDHAPASVSKMTLDTTAKVAAYSRYHHGTQASLAPKTFTRAELEHLIAKWPPRHKPSPPMNGITLAGKDSFSHAVNSAFSMPNLTNIYGLDDAQLKTAFFEALLEREASHQFRCGSNTHIQKLLNIKERYARNGMTVSGEVGTDNELHWNLNKGSVKGTSWRELLRMIFNLSRMDALATLASVLGMSFDNLSRLSSDRHALELNGGSRPSEDVPASLRLSGLPAGSTYAKLMGKKYIYGNAGQIIGAILRYSLNGNDFCLPATVGRGVLCMGKYKPTAHFLNQHLMDKHPSAQVIFFQDMRTALAFERMLGETRGYDPETFIVTAHLGTDLSVLPWNYFHGHEVVFISAPTKVCMAMVKLYKEQIAGAQIKGFRVYPGFVLNSQPSDDLANHVEDVTDAEAELLRGAVWLDTVERPTWLMEQMAKKGISYDEFSAWGQKLGIFKAPKEQHNCGVVPSLDSLSLFQPHSGPAAPLMTNFKSVTTRQVFVPGGITLLHGLKDSGKSITCLTAAKAIITGERLFDVIPSGEEFGNILYMDSETPQELLTTRLTQFGLIEELNKRLFLLSKFDHNATDSVFSISDQAFRDHVEKILHKQNCRYLVLDNLTSLMDDGSLYQATAVSQLFNWLEKLAKQGFSIILVSHTQEDASAGTAAAKARGSQEFSIRAHTEIVLVRNTEIQEKALGTEAVQHALAHDGLTVGICFKVCKAACILQKKTFWLHLPLGASEWQFLAATGADGKEIEFPTGEISTIEPSSEKERPSLTSNAAPSQPARHDLSPDQRAVLEILKKGSAKRKDIEEKTGFGEDKVRDMLNALTTMRIVSKEGQGKATYYALKSTP